MNSIYRKGKCLTAVLALFLLAACSSDDDSYYVPGSENFTRDMIVGEWFEPAGEGAYGIGHYKEDGSLTSTMIRATKNDWMNTVDEGYWDYSDGLLTVVTNLQHKGILNTNTKGVYRMIKVTKYEIQASSLDMDFISGGYRIVDTYQMNVGESRQAIINDREFVPQDYSSLSYHVASIDENGNIEARHLGTTYILIKSSIGTAVIRVVVSDSANVFNDALQVLGLPVQTITKEYGQIYLEKAQDDGTTVRLYRLAESNVMAIKMRMDTDGSVQYIEQFFTNQITPDAVREALNRKYEFQYTVTEGDERFDWYLASWQCRWVEVVYLEKEHQIVMFFMDDINNLKEYDDFFNQVMNMDASLLLVAYSMGYTLTGNDYLNKSFTTSAPYPFTSVEVSTDEQGYVNRATLYFDDNITFQDIEYHIKRNYLPTNNPNTYTNSYNTYFLSFEIGEDGYMKYLHYEKIIE